MFPSYLCIFNDLRAVFKRDMRVCEHLAAGYTAVSGRGSIVDVHGTRTGYIVSWLPR